MRRICLYILKTKELGLVTKPDISKVSEFYTDADW